MFTSRYTNVHVLMLSWQDDDLGVSKEIHALSRTFTELFSFTVTQHTIPSVKPERKLNRRVAEFLDDYDDKHHLLIVYYAGHGYLNAQRVPMWAA